MWNQCLINLDFDDNKTKFGINDYISNVNVRRFSKWQL